jgi:hypothetical protein
MQQEIINKFGKEVLTNFWVFVENLQFDGSKKDASTVRSEILKKISPSTADKYKEIADELAFSLYRDIFFDKKSMYLYASFEAVSKGSVFYDNCWDNPAIIIPIAESIDQFNNFSTVIPTEDDYFVFNTPTPQEVWEDYEDYDYRLESSGNKKGKKKTNKSNTEEFEY